MYSLCTMDTMRIVNAPPAETDVAFVYPELPKAVTKEQEQDNTSLNLDLICLQKLVSFSSSWMERGCGSCHSAQEIQAWSQCSGWRRHGTAGRQHGHKFWRRGSPVHRLYIAAPVVLGARNRGTGLCIGKRGLQIWWPKTANKG